jgi:hypothetical protein
LENFQFHFQLILLDSIGSCSGFLTKVSCDGMMAEDMGSVLAQFPTQIHQFSAVSTIQLL